MAIPILGRRKIARQAELAAAIEAGVEKAISPMIAQAAAQSQGSSGATYPVGRGPSSPFSQTGGSGGSFAPLPRGDDTFNSLFGPGYPLIPDPLDPVGPNGRSMPRRSQYLVAWNLQLTDRQIPWTMLQWLAEQCDVVNRCIQLVQDGIVGRNWSWGFSDSVIEQIMAESGETNHARAMALAKDQYGTELDKVKSFFENPDPRMGQTFSQWLTEMCWDVLVYDAVAVYPQFNLGGDLMGLSLIDPTTIKVLRDNQGYKPLPPAPAYQQILYGFPRGEYQADDPTKTDIEGQFTYDQLSYYIRRQRPETVYGYPQVEEVMTIATTYLARQAWMSAEYTFGAMPKTFFEMGTDMTWTPEQTMWYEQQFNDRLSGQVQRRQQAFLLPGGMKPTFAPQVDEHYKSDYDNFLITQIGSKFGVPATQLGVQAKAGLSGGKQMEGESDQTEHYVMGALVNYFIDIMNDLAHRYLGVGPEITATCQDASQSTQDLIQQSTADKNDLSIGKMTLNDLRAKNGLPLYDMPEADEPFILTATGPTFLKGTLAVQDANTENTLNPPPPPTQVMVGPDGQPLPNQGGADGSDASANGGLQPVPSGAGSGEAKPDGNSGSSGTSGSSDQSDKTDSDGGTTVGGSKDESTTAKAELSTFVKFAKSRTDGGKWRDFTFSAIDPVRAAWLNQLGRSGNLDLIKATTAQPIAAGIVCKADDTGRVLMVQRGIDNHNDQAAGLFEWPGGRLKDGEDAFTAAQREWEEELGTDLPKGDVVGSWLTPDGRYQAFVYVIKRESDVDLDDANYDDKEIENAAWWTPKDIVGNSMVRVEVQSADWSLLGHAKKSALDPKADAQKAGQTTRSKWADHPNHELHDKIVEHYAPLLAQALRDSVHGIHEAIVVAQRKAATRETAKSVRTRANDAQSRELFTTANALYKEAEQLVKAGTDDAMDAVNANVTMQPSDAADVLRRMIGDSYLAGSHVAAGMIGGGAKVLESLEGASTGLDWANWKPGWLQAAGNVRDGGLADLLSQAMATIQGVQGTALTRLGNVLADGIASGDSVQTIAGSMTDMVMSPDRALVIANTETARSMVSATLSTYDQNGVAQWEWMAEDDACPICDALDGQTFDVSDSGAEQIPEHPSCFPAGTLINTPTVIGSTERWFDGELVEITTAAGEFVSVTPNHPILTDKGWIAAGLLDEGNNIIRCIDVERVILSVDPDNNYRPSVIEDIAKTFGGSLGVVSSSVPTSAIDFHGDGLNGQISIIRSNGLLGSYDEATIAQHGNHRVFTIPNVYSSVGFNSVGDLDTSFERGHASPNGVMGSLGKSQPVFAGGIGHSDVHRCANISRLDSMLNQSSTNNSTGDSEFKSQRLLSFSSEITSNYGFGDVDAIRASNDFSSLQGSRQGAAGDSGALANFFDGLAGLIESDRIVHLGRVSFSGHVYNLQTTTGWYVANGMIVHNCRCAPLPVIDSQDVSQPTLDSSTDDEGDN